MKKIKQSKSYFNLKNFIKEFILKTTYHTNKLKYSNSLNKLFLNKRLNIFLELPKELLNKLEIDRKSHDRIQFAYFLIQAHNKSNQKLLNFGQIEYHNNIIPLEERKLQINGISTELYGSGIKDSLYTLEVKAFMYKINAYLTYSSNTHYTQLLKLQTYTLLSDINNINKLLDKVIHDFISKLNELDTNEQDISYFTHQLKISVSVFSLINNASAYFMETKGELIEVNSFYEYFDEILVYKQKIQTSITKKELESIENSMYLIFTNYTAYSSSYKDPKVHNTYLENIYPLFGGVRIDILTVLSLPSYYSSNCSFKLLSQSEYKNIKIKLENNFNIDDFYNLLRLSNILYMDTAFLCEMFIKNKYEIMDSEDFTKVNNILRLLLENSKFYSIFFDMIEMRYRNEELERSNRLSSGFMLISACTKCGMHDEAKAYLFEMLENFNCKSSFEAMQYINAMNLLSMLTDNKELFEKLYYQHIFMPLYRDKLTVTNVLYLLKVQSMISKIYNFQVLQTIYKSKLQININPSASDQLIIINPYSDMNNYYSPIHIYKKIIDKQIPIINLSESEIPFFNERNDILTDKIPKISADNDSIIGINMHWTELFCNWEISFIDKKIMCNGINMYQTFFETEARSQKMFSIDWNSSITQYYFKLFQRRVDRNAYIYELLVNSFPNKSIKFIASMYHSVPLSYYSTRFAKNNNPKKESLIQVNSAYENRAVEVENSTFDSISALNLTLNKKSRAVLFGSSENFSQWANKQIDSYTLKHEISIINKDQTSNDLWQKKIYKARSEGKIIACILGKLLYDLCVPYMGGTFENMKEFAKATNDFVIENENIFLLVKAHPHEINYPVSNVVQESFHDWFSTDKNIYKLGHKEVGLDTLIPYVDVFLLWNGTSVIDFAKERKYIIVGDDWANNDYPIGLYQPKDKNEYFSAILKAKKWDNNSKEAYKRAKLAELYNQYLNTREFTVRNLGVIRSSTNVNWNRPYLDQEKVINEMEFQTQPWDKILEKIFEV